MIPGISSSGSGYRSSTFRNKRRYRSYGRTGRPLSKGYWRFPPIPFFGRRRSLALCSSLFTIWSKLLLYSGISRSARRISGYSKTKARNLCSCSDFFTFKALVTSPSNVQRDWRRCKSEESQTGRNGVGDKVDKTARSASPGVTLSIRWTTWTWR